MIGQIWLNLMYNCIKLLYSPTGEYNKIEIFKMAASRFVEVSDKEMNSDQKNTKKTCAKILKQLFASGSVIIAIGEYSPRRIFSDNHLAFGE